MCLLSNSHLLPRRVPRSLLANIPPTWTVSGHLQCCHGAPSHQDLPPAFPVAAGTFLYNVHQIAFLSCLNPDARTIAFGIKSEVLAMAACPRAPAFAYPSPPGASFSMLFTGLHSLRPSFLPWNTPSSFPPHRTFAFAVSAAWNSLCSEHEVPGSFSRCGSLLRSTSSERTHPVPLKFPFHLTPPQ